MSECSSSNRNKEVDQILIVIEFFCNLWVGLSCAVLFFFLSAFFEILCLLLYAFVFPKLEIVKFYRSKTAAEGSKTVTADLAAGGVYEAVPVKVRKL